MRINYFPAGGLEFASSRLRVFKIAAALRNLGHGVIFKDFSIANCDAIVFQKNWNHYGAMQMFKAAGKRIIFDVDDLIATPIPPEVDVITVDTAAKLALFPNAVVIPDALDVESNSPRKVEHAEKLTKVVWVGNSENTYHLRNAAEACRRLGLELTVITDLHGRSYAHYDGVQGLAWDLHTVDDEMIKADLFISPFIFDGEWGEAWVKSKSPNRLLKAHALGLPVVATMIPSFEDVGIFCAAYTVDEWVGALRMFESKEVRERDAERGLAIAQRYTADKVVEKWLEVFRREN
jgi:hypothetical protein